MTGDEKRMKVRSLYLSRKGKNIYTQGGDRKYFFGKPEGKNTGYSDCSSSIRAAYKKALGIDIGSNTAAQVRRKLGRVVDKTDGLYPNEANLKIGDCLYFKGNSTHVEGVGHVELYIGSGKCAGHGSGKGPKTHALRSYCKSRGKAKRYYKAIRWIEDGEAPEPEPEDTAPTTPPIGGQLRVAGGNVYIRTGPDAAYESVAVAKEGDMLTAVPAEGWRPVLVDGEIRWASEKYVKEVT